MTETKNEKDTQSNLNVKTEFTEKVKRYFKNLVDFSNFDKKTIVYIIILLVLIAISVYLLYILLFVDNTILLRLVVNWFVNPIYDLKFLGILLFIGAMAIQGLLIPIPSEIVLLSAGMIWGWFGGGIMGIIGSLGAATLCYFISRKGGRPLAEKFVGISALNMADSFIHKYGLWAIIVARFLPFLAFDPISYASGLVDLDYKRYIGGTFIGTIPRAFFYAVLGSLTGLRPPITLNQIPDIQAQANFFNIILGIIVVVLLGMFLIYYITSKLWEKRHSQN
ncbi:MAG: VTT domain-containing protein [Candidatus Lokiarchaeota archaeon]